jgi:hypothetical protein
MCVRIGTARIEFERLPVVPVSAVKITMLEAHATEYHRYSIILWE